MTDDFPTKNRNRAKRRYLKQKMKQKARRLAKYVFGWGSSSYSKKYYTEEVIEDFACKSADNMTRCSCWMCRNPRRNKELTLDEKRNAQSFNEQLSETE